MCRGIGYRVCSECRSCATARRDAFRFCVPEAEEVHVTVRVFAEAGEALGEPLAQTAFTLDLSGGKTAVLKISDDAEDALQIEYAG